MLTFQDLSLIEPIIQNLTNVGYSLPTQIQAEAIPRLLARKDLLGIAQTGTGKTAAFCLPVIQNLVSSSGHRVPGLPKALILVPTRELCLQVVESIEVYSRSIDIRACAIFGGVDQKEQVAALKSGVDIVVATPGRLLDLIEQRHLRLSGIEYLVLDEADRMLDMGFHDDIQEIVQKIPENRQTMLFSATMPVACFKLSISLLKNPAKVEVSPPATTVDRVSQKIIFCKADHKFQLLRKILKEEPGLTLVFTTTKENADLVTEYLIQHRIATGAIHSEKKQTERERHLSNFRAKAIKVLVATDIASRGIDVDGITRVINFDLPLSAEAYVHRIGRTGRAGAAGKAISFCDESEKHLLEKIKQLSIPDMEIEKFEGKFEQLRLEISLSKRKKAPTPGKSQEKTAYLDHSKRQRPLKAGESQKQIHPGLRNSKKKRR